MSKKAEKEYMNSVAQLGCIACSNMGYMDTPAELHHIRTGQGMSQRASNYDVIPLCPYHHRSGGHGNAVHAGQKTWEANHGTELELLEQVKQCVEQPK
jgi:hypothetical protein